MAKNRAGPTPPFSVKKHLFLREVVTNTVEDEIDDDAKVDGYESVQSGGKGEVARGTHYRGATADGTPAEKIIGRMNVIGRMNMISMMNMISRLNMIGMMNMIGRMYMISRMNLISRMYMIVLKASIERRCWPPSSNISNDIGLPYSPMCTKCPRFWNHLCLLEFDRLFNFLLLL